MDKFEKLVKEIMAEALADGEPVTREEAEEMAKMELGAKGMSREARSINPTKKADRKPRTVKVSDEKVNLFNSILQNIDRCEGIERESVKILKENKLIQVRIGEKTFKIDIIEERKKK